LPPVIFNLSGRTSFCIYMPSLALSIIKVPNSVVDSNFHKLAPVAKFWGNSI
jgi:hypothetical protein